jgi:CheY-like chemotaxis protein
MDLAKRLSDNEKLSSYLEKSIATIMRARNLTNQLLTFARGGAPVRKTESIVPVIIETVEFALSGSNVSINFDIQENLHNCNFDSSQISQVFDNVAINAKQAMPNGGTLTVKGENITLEDSGHGALKNGDYIKITFTDTGRGIPREVIQKIFDPFFTTKRGGSGLGLTTSYSIINRHGGTIEIESSANEGSSFIIYLPSSHYEEEQNDAQEPVALNATGRILIVDDELVIRDSLGALLEMMGYETVSADDGFQALKILKEVQDGKREPLKAVILDLTIPGGMGGIDTIEVIRKSYPHLPVFVSSGYAENPVMAEPQKYGFTASISKPFTFEELASILKEYLP